MEQRNAAAHHCYKLRAATSNSARAAEPAKPAAARRSAVLQPAATQPQSSATSAIATSFSEHPSLGEPAVILSDGGAQA